MTTPTRGSLRGQGLSIAVIQSRFNAPVTEALLGGALEALREHGVDEENIEVVSVPGAVEVPLVAQRLASAGALHGIVAVGAVIRGETSHFDYVCKMVADGCNQVSLSHNIPVGFGIVTTENAEQAFARSAPGKDNKGRHTAEAVIELANLLRGDYA